MATSSGFALCLPRSLWALEQYLAVLTVPYFHPHWPGQGGLAASSEIPTSSLKVNRGNKQCNSKNKRVMTEMDGDKAKKDFFPGLVSVLFWTLNKCVQMFARGNAGLAPELPAGRIPALEPPPWPRVLASGCSILGCCC